MPELDRDLKTSHLSRHLATADTQRKTASWDIWVCADALYSHDYDREVSFLVQAGAAAIKLSTGETVEVVAGDFVTIEPGVSAQWLISIRLENRYCYHDSFDIAERRTPATCPLGCSDAE